MKKFDTSDYATEVSSHYSVKRRTRLTDQSYLPPKQESRLLPRPARRFMSVEMLADVWPERHQIALKAVLSQRLPRDAPHRTIRQYAHGLLLELHLYHLVLIAGLYGQK